MKARTKTRKAYKFEKLPKAAQQRAIDKNSDINVDHDWWDFTYEDAKNIGLKITSSDESGIDSTLQDSVYEICTAILKNHGDTCDTYKLAMEYIPQFVAIRLKGWDPESDAANYNYWHIADYLFEDKEEDERGEYYDEWADEFKAKLDKLYHKMLQDEYEYQITEEAIRETLISNDYDFNEEGEIV